MPDWQEFEDRQLIHAAQGGEAEAFGELYERYAERVFRYLFAHLSNRMDVEDLTEEVFLRVWRSLPRYKERGVPFLAFLYRIAHNVLVDHYRRAERATPQVALNDLPIRDQAPGPGEMVMMEIDHQELRAMLGRLRADYRKVLALRFLSGLTPDETAEVMGRSAGAVRVLQHRALAALRKLMEQV